MPLVGLALAGRPFAEFLAFPPRTRFLPHAPFAWGAFALYAIPFIAAIGLYAVALANARAIARRPPASRFPWWGWLGIALAAASWFFAWRGDLVAPEYRRHLFTPLWLGYILLMNALVFRRTGASLLTQRTAGFLVLFAVSALYWWLFEHLNRFAGNWHYSGIVAAGDADYFFQATLPFSTVLPAIASTWVWLRTFARLDAMALPRLEAPAWLAWVALAVGLIALAAIGLAPDALFSMLWLAPLALLAALQRLVVGETIFSSIARGDWRPILLPALAGLVCGLLWELWNWGSLAKWQYSVPYVQRFHLFEMPFLGYAGYLPFGVECALVIDVVARALKGGGAWPLEAK